jgi:hypothetical protein
MDALQIQPAEHTMSPANTADKHKDNGILFSKQFLSQETQYADHPSNTEEAQLSK